MTEIVNNKVFNDFLLVKLNANAVAATTNMIQYWIIVTVFPAQKEPSALPGQQCGKQKYSVRCKSYAKSYSKSL